jgi:hypothetical protein
MATIEGIVRSINRELTPEFDERLRAKLAEHDRDWLIDQIVRLTLDRHSLEEIDRRGEAEAKSAARAERLARLREMAIDEDAVRSFVSECEGLTREALIERGFLSPGAPAKGTALLGPAHRSDAGERLLRRAKDMLFGLLFGDAASSTALERTHHELLTVALPRYKAGALGFMRASTELSAHGTWQDPESVSSDERAENVLLEIQFGEVEDELVGDGIVAALSVINNLEINEQVLYARMIDIEQTTLIS